MHGLLRRGGVCKHAGWSGPGTQVCVCLPSDMMHSPHAKAGDAGDREGARARCCGKAHTWRCGLAANLSTRSTRLGISRDTLGMATQCGICLEEGVEEIGELSGPGCAHTYCWPCITRWADSENRCPACRERFTSISRKRLAPESCQEGQGPSKRLRGEVLETVQVQDKKQQWRPDDLLGVDLDSLRCEICGTGEDEHELMLCDGCDRGFHVYCVQLPSLPDEEWYCPECEEARVVLEAAAHSQGRRRRGGRRGSAGQAHSPLGTAEDSWLVDDDEDDDDGSGSDDSAIVIEDSDEDQLVLIEEEEEEEGQGRAGLETDEEDGAGVRRGRRATSRGASRQAPTRRSTRQARRGSGARSGATSLTPAARSLMAAVTAGMSGRRSRSRGARAGGTPRRSVAMVRQAQQQQPAAAAAARARRRSVQSQLPVDEMPIAALIEQQRREQGWRRNPDGVGARGSGAGVASSPGDSDGLRVARATRSGAALGRGGAGGFGSRDQRAVEDLRSNWSSLQAGSAQFASLGARGAGAGPARRRLQLTGAGAGARGADSPGPSQTAELEDKGVDEQLWNDAQRARGLDRRAGGSVGGSASTASNAARERAIAALQRQTAAATPGAPGAGSSQRGGGGRSLTPSQAARQEVVSARETLQERRQRISEYERNAGSAGAAGAPLLRTSALGAGSPSSRLGASQRSDKTSQGPGPGTGAGDRRGEHSAGQSNTFARFARQPVSATTVTARPSQAPARAGRYPDAIGSLFQASLQQRPNASAPAAGRSGTVSAPVSQLLGGSEPGRGDKSVANPAVGAAARAGAAALARQVGGSQGDGPLCLGGLSQGGGSSAHRQEVEGMEAGRGTSGVQGKGPEPSHGAGKAASAGEPSAGHAQPVGTAERARADARGLGGVGGSSGLNGASDEATAQPSRGQAGTQGCRPGPSTALRALLGAGSSSSAAASSGRQAEHGASRAWAKPSADDEGASLAGAPGGCAPPSQQHQQQQHQQLQQHRQHQQQPYCMYDYQTYQQEHAVVQYEGQQGQHSSTQPQTLNPGHHNHHNHHQNSQHYQHYHPGAVGTSAPAHMSGVLVLDSALNSPPAAAGTAQQYPAFTNAAAGGSYLQASDMRAGQAALQPATCWQAPGLAGPMQGLQEPQHAHPYWQHQQQCHEQQQQQWQQQQQQHYDPFVHAASDQAGDVPQNGSAWQNGHVQPPPPHAGPPVHQPQQQVPDMSVQAYGWPGGSTPGVTAPGPKGGSGAVVYDTPVPHTSKGAAAAGTSASAPDGSCGAASRKGGWVATEYLPGAQDVIPETPVSDNAPPHQLPNRQSPACAWGAAAAGHGAPPLTVLDELACPPSPLLQGVGLLRHGHGGQAPGAPAGQAPGSQGLVIPGSPEGEPATTSSPSRCTMAGPGHQSTPRVGAALGEGPLGEHGHSLQTGRQGHAQQSDHHHHHSGQHHASGTIRMLIHEPRHTVQDKHTGHHSHHHCRLDHQQQQCHQHQYQDGGAQPSYSSQPDSEQQSPCASKPRSRGFGSPPNIKELCFSLVRAILKPMYDRNEMDKESFKEVAQAATAALRRSVESREVERDSITAERSEVVMKAVQVALGERGLERLLPAVRHE